MSRSAVHVVDPRDAQVVELLARHHAFVNLHSPPEDVHALDVAGLLHPSVTMFALGDDGVLVGIGALKELGDGHAEVKSMHTLDSARGRGVAGALVDHIVEVARSRGLERLSLESGSLPPFAPAWSVYASRGFVLCGPFGSYAPSPNSRFMTLELGS